MRLHINAYVRGFNFTFFSLWQLFIAIIFATAFCKLYLCSAGAEGEVIGILEFWVCLHPQVELTEPQMERATSRTAVRQTRGLEWAHGETEVDAIIYSTTY